MKVRECGTFTFRGKPWTVQEWNPRFHCETKPANIHLVYVACVIKDNCLCY